MTTIEEYSRNTESKNPPLVGKQSIWTRPIYIHVMPQLRRKISLKACYITVAIWLVILVVVAVYFFIK